MALRLARGIAIICAQSELPGYGFFSANHSAVFLHESWNHGISPEDSVNDSG
jgi:hypothetical protein